MQFSSKFRPLFSSYFNNHLTFGTVLPEIQHYRVFEAQCIFSGKRWTDIVDVISGTRGTAPPLLE